jgi:hypothetical protein
MDDYASSWKQRSKTRYMWRRSGLQGTKRSPGWTQLFYSEGTVTLLNSIARTTAKQSQLWEHSAQDERNRGDLDVSAGNGSDGTEHWKPSSIRI